MNQELNLIESTIEKVAQSTSLRREKEIKRIIEALLFASNSPLTLDKLREIITTTYPIRNRDLQKLMKELSTEYRTQQHAFQIDLIADGYLLRTEPAMHPYLEMLYQDKRGEKLSPAAREVLAVIAYRGPITRREIETLRGVDCSGTLSALIERNLIKIAGRKESPGRPHQYGITQQFLHYFGLRSLADLRS